MLALAVSVMAGIRPANSLRMLSPRFFDSVLAARNFPYSICCVLRSRINAAPRMLSPMTRFSQSMASCPLRNNCKFHRQHQLKNDGDEGNDAQDAQTKPPVDGKQKHAGADDDEQRRNVGGYGLGDKQLHRIDIRKREVGQKFCRGDVFDPCERLHRNPGVSRDRRSLATAVPKHTSAPQLCAYARINRERDEQKRLTAAGEQRRSSSRRGKGWQSGMTVSSASARNRQ